MCNDKKNITNLNLCFFHEKIQISNNPNILFRNYFF